VRVRPSAGDLICLVGEESIFRWELGLTFTETKVVVKREATLENSSTWPELYFVAEIPWDARAWPHDYMAAVRGLDGRFYAFRDDRVKIVSQLHSGGVP
jgi:hypothetical protein